MSVRRYFKDNVVITLEKIRMSKPARIPLSNVKVLDYQGESAVIMNRQMYQRFSTNLSVSFYLLICGMNRNLILSSGQIVQPVNLFWRM